MISYAWIYFLKAQLPRIVMLPPPLVTMDEEKKGFFWVLYKMLGKLPRIFKLLSYHMFGYIELKNTTDFSEETSTQPNSIWL